MLNKFNNRLTHNACKFQLKDLADAKLRLEEYTRLHTLMHYAGMLSDRSVLLLNRANSNNPTVALSIWRGSKHNSVEKLFPEIEALIEGYYDLLDQLEGHPEWQTKVQYETGAQIAYLASFFDESSRDKLVNSSEAFRRFDSDKQKFFK